MRGPEPFRGGRVVRGSFGLVDLMPTFLEWVGMAPATGIEGRSALSLFRADGAGWPVTGQIGSRGSPSRRSSVRTVRWKWIGTIRTETDGLQEELYDLVADPAEQDELLGKRSGAAAWRDADFLAAVERARRELRGHEEEGASGAVVPRVGAIRR
jgi:arylsulfatase A-like enzyme